MLGEFVAMLLRVCSFLAFISTLIRTHSWSVSGFGDSVVERRCGLGSIWQWDRSEGINLRLLGSDLLMRGLAQT